MSLFRIEPESPVNGPHQQQPVQRADTNTNQAESAMILVHGRGATAQSMLQFAGEFRSKPEMHFAAIQASGNTWYPHSFLAPKQMNEPGISSGLQAIYDEIMHLNDSGIPTEKIVLLGFSQGACLATEFAARHPLRYGGIIGLSGGLIGDEVDPQNYSGSLSQTPVFLGCSNNDPHIPRERVDLTAQIFEQLEALVTKRIYKGMGHTVNEDEIEQINKMLASL